MYVFATFTVVIAIVVKVSGDDEFQDRLHPYVVNDITELNPIPMAKVVASADARMQWI